MAELTILQNGQREVIPFDGTPLLDDVLKAAGRLTPHPCGGRGTCGKCAVILTGEVSPPNTAEQRAGVRLSCQAVLYGNAVVILPDEKKAEQIETTIGALPTQLRPMSGRYGAAVDIGTTTVAVKVYDMADGTCIGEAAARNPQTAVAADVMGRIEAALNGELAFLQQQIVDCIASLLREAVAVSGLATPVDSLVLTGNTTMLYLLTGSSPESLARAPFCANRLFDDEVTLLGAHTYLPPCMNAFVGADITCAVFASGMCQHEGVTLLCDVGTNGELALWKDGRLYVTSTAAGPAFEGAGISCGCGSVRGAIDRVWLEDGALRVHTIGDAEAVGVCGSGLIDAIAAGLAREDIDETGALEEDSLPLCDTVALLPQDIRAVQLAKAAIAAGIATLMKTADVRMEDVEALYIAGGFGSHLNVDNAAAIGLIPKELRSRVHIIGNAALTGAVHTLLDVQTWQELRRIASVSYHVDLGGNPCFNELYVTHMFFE